MSFYFNLLRFYFGEISRRNFVVRGLLSWFVVRAKTCADQFVHFVHKQLSMWDRFENSHLVLRAQK